MNLYDAVKKGNLERVKLLVEEGADKNKVNSDGNTPLYLGTSILLWPLGRGAVSGGARCIIG